MTAPQLPEKTDHEKMLAALHEQTVWLKKLNEKFAFFLILLIVSGVIQLIF